MGVLNQFQVRMRIFDLKLKDRLYLFFPEGLITVINVNLSKPAQVGYIRPTILVEARGTGQSFLSNIKNDFLIMKRYSN
jgi:hypothetical protein